CDNVCAVPPPAEQKAKAKGPDPQFKVDGKDLVVSLMIEGPAVRQVVLTDFRIDDGKPTWEEEILGRKPVPRPPSGSLRYCVIVNHDLPGFMDRGLMMVPTPESVRKQQRQEVTWRLPNYRAWGFRKEDATFSVEVTRFETSSEQLRQALPKIKKTIDDADQRLKGKGGGALTTPPLRGGTNVREPKVQLRSDPNSLNRLFVEAPEYDAE